MTETREKKKEEDTRRLPIRANRCSAIAAVAGRQQGDSTLAYWLMPPAAPFFFCRVHMQLHLDLEVTHRRLFPGK